MECTIIEMVLIYLTNGLKSDRCEIRLIFKKVFYILYVYIYIYIYLYIDYVHERQNDLSLFLDTKQNTE
jgi:hypothetical protein